MTETTLIEFPCDFPIKIIGVNSPLFIEQIKAIATKHFPTITDKSISQQPSKNSNFISLRVTVHAKNQAMLDDFYREVSKHPEVKMVL
ncbi:MAG: DUF493 domain-containing protein [Legionella sp.]|nr:MAG: DUF493 domain-containing protein [Legionella sp.]